MGQHEHASMNQSNDGQLSKNTDNVCFGILFQLSDTFKDL